MALWGSGVRIPSAPLVDRKPSGLPPGGFFVLERSGRHGRFFARISSGGAVAPRWIVSEVPKMPKLKRTSRVRDPENWAAFRSTLSRPGFDYASTPLPPLTVAKPKRSQKPPRTPYRARLPKPKVDADGEESSLKARDRRTLKTARRIIDRNPTLGRNELARRLARLPGVDLSEVTVAQKLTRWVEKRLLRELPKGPIGRPKTS
jgi:hypothetical protein